MILNTLKYTRIYKHAHYSILTFFISFLVSGLKASAFRTVMQCSSVADAQPKQFPSLRGAAERGAKERPSPAIGVTGVAGSLDGETFPE